MPVNYLSVEKLTKSYNENELFDDVTFGIQQGQKVALIGVNGCGKSTLLDILAGKENADSGVVSFQKGLIVRYLSQTPNPKEYLTIHDSIYNSSTREARLLKEYNLLSTNNHITSEEEKRLEWLLTEIDRLNAWDYEHRAKEILGKLGIRDLQQTISNLSGGQKKRIALAQVLIDKPDFLILDEPTNHLDLEIIEWLEEYLSKANLSLIMVTHDRYFLDQVTNEILEIDKGGIRRFEGNYANYLEKKGLLEEQQKATKDKARNLMKKELDWIRRQPKARGTKAKYRIDAFEETKQKANMNLTRKELEIKVSGSRQGKKIAEIRDISKSFGDELIFHSFSYVFKRNEKIGIVGKNGTGKSTFLNVLTGGLIPDSGMIDLGQNTRFGYYTQSESTVNESFKVLEVLKQVAEVITLDDGSTVTASQLLNQFLFPPEKQHDFVSKLSGGEKRRLQLLMVLISNPNFLILDEPTNDLDILTLNILEDYLSNFRGCLILVSHDRYFMDRLVDHLFVFDNTEEIKNFSGNYTDYRLAKHDEPQNTTKQSEEVKKSKNTQTKSVSNKLTFNERREFEMLENEIPKLDSRKTELTELLNSGSTDHDELQKWSEELEKLSYLLDELELRWLELSEKV